MAKISIIEAPHMWKLRLNKCVGERKFKSPYAASCYMIGKFVSDYLLIINGREYDWPTGASIESMVFEIEKHITHCIEIDEAFYGTN